MDFKKCYDAIVARALNDTTRSKQTGVFELHHIVPKCLGGGDEASNLVLLTPREHFICHLLLWRNDRSNYRLFASLLFFKQNTHVKNSRTYAEIREQHILFMKESNPSKFLSEASKKSKSEKLSAYSKNRSPEHLAAISAGRQGQQTRLGAVLTGETKATISNSLKDYFKHNQVSAETREKIAAANRGRVYSDDVKAKWAEAAKRRKKYKCPLCDHMPVDGGNFSKHLKKQHGLNKDEIDEIKATIAQPH